MPKTQTIKLAAGDDAVLLIHGLASSPLEMSSLATALKQRGFSVEVPHIRGFGFGTDVTCCEDWLAQVVENFDRLKREYRTVSVGGLCIGSVLSLALAIERPREVNALSLLSTTLFFDGWSIPWYRFLMPLWFHTPVRHLYTYTESDPYGIKNPEIRARVARAMERRGYVVTMAASVAAAKAAAEAAPPECAVVDMRLEDGNGLDAVRAIRARAPNARIIVLTGYGNIATTVAAMKGRQRGWALLPISVMRKGPPVPRKAGSPAG